MSAVYPTALRDFLKADADLDGDVRVQAVSSAYVYNAAHDFFDDVAAGARLGTPVSLANKTFVAGVFDADPVTYTGIAAATTVTGLVFYIWTGVEATSRLIYFEDKNADTTAISIAGNGNPWVIDWPLGYIFTI